MPAPPERPLHGGFRLRHDRPRPPCPEPAGRPDLRMSGPQCPPVDGLRPGPAADGHATGSRSAVRAGLPSVSAAAVTTAGLPVAVLFPRPGRVTATPGVVSGLRGAAVGLTRVSRGVHCFTDVIGGLLSATSWRSLTDSACLWRTSGRSAVSV
ncbi:phosphatase PAP2 family protein [Streptomyces sp. NPDC057540]|uniref:phosphatase PAP2 family protein n=1 Tax=Streptomyces sp. NPDC057540 TaxID=3346160 RepID=UPI0036A456ED